MLTSCDSDYTTDEAKQLAKDVGEVFKQGGFQTFGGFWKQDKPVVKLPGGFTEEDVPDVLWNQQRDVLCPKLILLASTIAWEWQQPF